MLEARAPHTILRYFGFKTWYEHLKIINFFSNLKCRIIYSKIKILN